MCLCISLCKLSKAIVCVFLSIGLFICLSVYLSRLGKASVWQRLQSRDDHDVSLTSSSNATDLRASLDRKRRRRC